MSRSKSREIVFKMLFPFSFGVADRVGIELVTENKVDAKELQYIDALYDAVVNNLQAIDDIIAGTAKGFSFDRIYRVDLTALRLGIGEIMYMEETPDVVVVNEVVNIVKRYGTESSGGYVNGILASVLKNKQAK